MSTPDETIKHFAFLDMYRGGLRRYARSLETMAYAVAHENGAIGAAFFDAAKHEAVELSRFVGTVTLPLDYPKQGDAHLFADHLLDAASAFGEFTAKLPRLTRPQHTELIARLKKKVDHVGAILYLIPPTDVNDAAEDAARHLNGAFQHFKAFFDRLELQFLTKLANNRDSASKLSEFYAPAIMKHMAISAISIFAGDLESRPKAFCSMVAAAEESASFYFILLNPVLNEQAAKAKLSLADYRARLIARIKPQSLPSGRRPAPSPTGGGGGGSSSSTSTTPSPVSDGGNRGSGTFTPPKPVRRTPSPNSNTTPDPNAPGYGSLPSTHYDNAPALPAPKLPPPPQTSNYGGVPAPLPGAIPAPLPGAVPGGAPRGSQRYSPPTNYGGMPSLRK